MNRPIGWLVLPSLLLGSSVYSFSAKITPEEAGVLATEFVRSKTGNLSGGVNLKPVYAAGTKSDPLYYVFNLADNKGFVMISAEDATTTPVLGYSFEKGFPADNLPEVTKWMLAGLEREIKAAPSLQRSLNADERRKAVHLAGVNAQERKKQLTTAEWAQDGVFNQLIPGKPLVGCVGTATAIVMKYHNWPKQGTGEMDGVSFATAYDWGNMRLDNYRYGSSTKEQRDAVALLTYHVSKSIGTNYGYQASSAYSTRVPGALSSFFGYDPAMSYKKRSEMESQDGWNQLIINEIDANRPVINSGYSATNGHAFVCDGYDVQGQIVYFHYNWGWGGEGDGWFLPTVLVPSISEYRNYSSDQTIIYNIKPAEHPNTVWSPIRITSDNNQVGIGSDLTDLSNGKSFTVRVGHLTNSTYDDFKGKLAVALTDKAGNVKALLSNPVDCAYNGIGNIVESMGRLVTFNNCALPAGTSVDASDLVRIVSQANGSDNWLPLIGELYTTNELSTKPGTPASFNINIPSNIAGAKIEGASSVVKGFDYVFKVTPEVDEDENIITVKANGIILTSDNDTYRINNVRADQEIYILVQKASEVIAKRSVWVGTPGMLSSIISETEAANIKDLTLFGTLDARDFKYIRESMNLERCDLSNVTIAANGTDAANALPREAFRDERSLKEVILPNSVNRLNNGCFRSCGIKSIVIPEAVSKYEYNVFCGASALRDIYVRRSKPEFINWCVLSGTNKAAMTLHCPNETSMNNYKRTDEWKEIGNFVVDAPETVPTVAFAIQEERDVKFETEAKTGQVEKGTVVTFKAEYMADDDKRMEVYANATRLYPDADGNYKTTINSSTILHFDLIEPQKVIGDTKLWSLNGNNGALGMFTDATTVIPNQEFTVRLNALNVTQYSENLYWAIVLTDANGNIKEFISPVNTWQGGVGDKHVVDVHCKVTESKVRDGNLLRLVCSSNKKDWMTVKGVSADIIDEIPAHNREARTYMMNVYGMADEEGNATQITNATVSGLGSYELRGKEATLSIIPESSVYKVDMNVWVNEKDAEGNPILDENGDYKKVLKEQIVRAATVDYTFVVLEDMSFEVKVHNPAIGTVQVIETYPGGLHIQLSENNVAETVKITGSCRSQDLLDGLNKDWAVKTVKVLDLSELNIVAEGSRHLANELKHTLFKSPTGTPAVLEKLILPNSILRIWKEGVEGPFDNCKNIEEIALPEGVKSIPFTTGTSSILRYTLGTNIFQGCDKLKVIRIVGDPQEYNGKQCVCYFSPSGYKWGHQNYSLGHPDASKVTLIVPEQHLPLFLKPDDDMYTGNPWLPQGYNILSVTPVYGVEFDPARVRLADETVLADQMVNFLGDNVAKETITIEGKIFPANPDANATVYVDGEKVELAADGSIPVTFHNPKFHPELAKSHKIEVEYTVDLNFNAISDAFTISEPEIIYPDDDLNTQFMHLSELGDEGDNNGEENDGEIGEENGGENGGSTPTHIWDTNDKLNPVLRGVKENAKIRFKVKSNIDENKGVISKVMIGNEELTADADGYYMTSLSGANKLIEIYAAPTEGATITAAELTSIKPEEAAGISSISIEGEMTDEQLKKVVNDFKNLETLDISSLETSELPAGLFAGMETLSTVSLPEVETIGANMFKDCSSLQSVDIPSSVNTIGEGAFAGCSSLEHLTLTGVSGVDANAFNGCDNLTTITFLSIPSNGGEESTAKVRRSVRSINSDAFAGVNPNCIIVLDEGVAIPDAKANYIHAAEGDVTEISPEGTETVRRGRIYSAKNNISIVQGYPLAIPHAFTLENGAKVMMEADIKDWTSIVAPFDVQKIYHSSNSEVEFIVAGEEDDVLKNNVIYSLVDDTHNLTSVSGIKANTPVIVRLKEDSKITLEAGDIKVPSTPTDVRVDGKDFSLHAIYQSQSVPASETYVLNESGVAFAPVEADDENEEMATLRPFQVYATSPVAVSEIPTELPSSNVETGIDEEVVSGVKFVKEKGMLVVYTPEAFTTNLYNADGLLLNVIKLDAGRNVISLPGAGVYVIAGRKIVF